MAKLLFPFGALAIIMATLILIFNRRYHQTHAQHSNPLLSNPLPFLLAAIILGMGIGGFIDGIVFHQILQWHQLFSAQIPPLTVATKSINMFWDGIFHCFTLVVVITGIILLWRASCKINTEKTFKLLWSGLLIGWGLFNVTEGIINHHLLHLHNVREVTGDIDFWNDSFLGLSLLLIVMGYLLLPRRIQRFYY